jgi:hypothetical protein
MFSTICSYSQFEPYNPDTTVIEHIINSNSQFEYYKPDIPVMKHNKGERSISVSSNVLINTPNGVQLAGGLKTRFFVSERVSIDADMVIGYEYFHTGPGILSVPFFLILPYTFSSVYLFDSYPCAEAFALMGVYILAFEHISYHIPTKKFTDISPYISLLRLKSAGNDEFPTNNKTGTSQFTFATGIEVNKYFGRFVLSPYIEYNIGYKDHISGINLGAYFGIRFPPK